MLQPLEELNRALGSFVDQERHFVLLLTTRDEEVPLVVRAMDAIDGESPADVFFTDTSPLWNAKQYADDVLRNAWAQLQEVNSERRAQGRPPLADVPAVFWSDAWTPTQRLAALIKHMASWLPPDGGHRLVITLLPSVIRDRRAHAEIIGGLVPFHGYEAWMADLRLVLRDDGAEPFAERGLRQAGVRSVALYTTQVTVAALADATAREAENRELSPARRINALLQCAAFDVALGRFDAAIQRYGTLYAYYDKYQVTAMKAVVVQGLGDIMSRLGRFPAAREKYLQALDIASDAQSLPLILHMSIAIGDVDMHLHAYPEAAQSYGLGANAAEKLGNPYARADLLEKTGEAQACSGDLRNAVQAWATAAVVAREFTYDARLAAVLERLRDVSVRAGYHDTAAAYDHELRDVRHRLSLGG